MMERNLAKPLKCVVIGGGISGITFAHHMNKVCRKGTVEITVLEKSNRLGGLIKTYPYEVTKGLKGNFYTGARTATIVNPIASSLLALASDLSMVEELRGGHKTSTSMQNRFMFYENNLVRYPLPPSLSNLPEVLSPKKLNGPFGYFFYLGLLTGQYSIMRFFNRKHMMSYSKFVDDVYDPKKNIAKLSVDEFHRLFFDEKTVEYFMNPRIRGIYGCSAKEVSAEVYLREFFPEVATYRAPENEFAYFFKRNEMISFMPDINLSSMDFYANSNLSSYFILPNSRGAKCAANMKLYHNLYVHGFRTWGLKDGFQSLIESAASNLVSDGVHNIYMNSYVKNISNNIVSTQSYYKSNFKKYTHGISLPSESEHKMKIYTSEEEIDADVIISTVPTKDLRGMMPHYDLAKVIPKVRYTSMITMSLVYNVDDIMNLYNGFGFLVPESQYHKLPITGCIFDDWIFSHKSYENKMKLEYNQDLPTRTFTFIMNMETLMDNGVDPFNDEHVRKTALHAMKLLFDTTKEPLIDRIERDIDCLPIYPNTYINSFDVMTKSLKKDMPYLHIIGNGLGIYSINSLSKVALFKAHELGALYEILEPQYINPSIEEANDYAKKAF